MDSLPANLHHLLRSINALWFTRPLSQEAVMVSSTAPWVWPLKCSALTRATYLSVSSTQCSLWGNADKWDFLFSCSVLSTYRDCLSMQMPSCPAFYSVMQSLMQRILAKHHLWAMHCDRYWGAAITQPHTANSLAREAGSGAGANIWHVHCCEAIAARDLVWGGPSSRKGWEPAAGRAVSS